MNDYQENHLSMFKTVNEVCNQNIALITPITALNDAYTTFVTNLGLINDVVLQQTLQIEGVAEDKTVLKYKLARIGSIVSNVVKAYAISIGDNTLKREVDYSESDLRRSRDVTIQLHCQTIYNLANTHLAALAAFGITPTVMTTLATAISDYQVKMQSPTVARDERAVATVNLASVITETNDLLRFQIDNNMRIMELSEPDFYKLYKNARKIIDLGGGRRAGYGTIKGVVREADTNLIVEGALIELLDTDAVVVSDALGEFSIDAEPNTYSIRVSKDDYEEIELNTIVVLKDEDVSVQVLLIALE